jgi:dihydrofolate synthase/folylpolyglutamate synthase
MLTLKGLAGVYPEVWLPLHGAHQADNAALALAAAELLLAPPDSLHLDLDVVREAFASVASPGRLEVVRSWPLVIVDAAHNPAGAQALAAAVTEVFPQRLVGLVGVLGDKDAEGILGALEPVLERVVVTEPLSPRALPVDVLAGVAAEVFGPDRVEWEPRLDDALARAVDLADEDAAGAPAALATGVLATGSVTVAGQVSVLLAPAPRPGR